MSKKEIFPRAIELHSANLGYKNTSILSNINITIEKGELVGIVGRSGAGKSTLLNSLSGMISPISGNVLVNGNSPSKSEHPVGLVPQISDEVLTQLSIEEIITLGSTRRGLFTSGAERKKANELIQKLGLTGLNRRRIDELSGGQRQRVSIARALMGSTKILLCDEPTSGADPVLAAEIISVLRDLATDGTTILVATHDLSVVIPRLDRVIGLGSGRVIYDGSTEKFTSSIQLEVYGAEITKGVA